MTAEFAIGDPQLAVALAEELFTYSEVLTVRVGGPGERSVYRVDVPRGDHAARSLAADPATRASGKFGVEVAFVRIGITEDGWGDPEEDVSPAVGERQGRGHRERKQND